MSFTASLVLAVVAATVNTPGSSGGHKRRFPEARKAPSPCVPGVSSPHLGISVTEDMR